MTGGVLINNYDKTTHFVGVINQTSGSLVAIFDGKFVSRTIQLDEFGKNFIYFGRDPQNDIVLTSRLVSSRQRIKNGLWRKRGFFCLSPEMGKKEREKIENLNQRKGKRNLSVRAALKDRMKVFFTWKKNKNSVTIIGYKKDLPKNVVIPEKINGVTVAEIEYAAFASCGNLSSVVIPTSVTKIAKSAFYDCIDLKEITIPNNVISISDDAFSRCWGLKSIIIPNSVTSIDDFAFFRCCELKSITIPNSVTSIGDYAFASCEEFTSITISNSVTNIDDSAFS